MITYGSCLPLHSFVIWFVQFGSVTVCFWPSPWCLMRLCFMCRTQLISSLPFGQAAVELLSVANGSMHFESLNSNVRDSVSTLSKVSVSSSSNFFRYLLEWHKLTTWSRIISFLFVNRMILLILTVVQYTCRLFRWHFVFICETHVFQTKCFSLV